MSRITDIRDVAASSKGHLSDALLQCLVLADEFEYAPLSDWASLELSGYRTRESLPDYRKTHSSLVGTLMEGNRYITKYTIPDLWIDEEYRERALTVCIHDGIPKLLTLPDDGSMGVSGAFHNWIESHITHRLQDKNGPFVGVRSTALAVPPGTYAGVIGAVQQSIVQFMIRLNRMFPSDKEFEARVDEETRREVDHAFTQIVIHRADNITIGSHNRIEDSSQRTEINIESGDAEALTAYLRGIGLDDDDIDEIDPLLGYVYEGNLSSSQESHLKGWIEAKGSKLAGALGKEAAVSLIVQALMQYAPAAAALL